MLVQINQITQHHIPEDSNFCSHQYENLMSHNYDCYARGSIVNKNNFYKLFCNSLEKKKTCCTRSDNLTTKTCSVQQLHVWSCDNKIHLFCGKQVLGFSFFFCLLAKKHKIRFSFNLPERMLEEPDLLRKQWLSHKTWVFHCDSTMVLMFSMELFCSL